MSSDSSMDMGKEEMNEDLNLEDDSVEEEGFEETSMNISKNLLPSKYVMHIKEDDLYFNNGNKDIDSRNIIENDQSTKIAPESDR